MTMYVVKRNGCKQPVQFDKITARIVKLCYGLNTDFVDPILVAQKVTAGMIRIYLRVSFQYVIGYSNLGIHVSITARVAHAALLSPSSQLYQHLDEKGNHISDILYDVMQVCIVESQLQSWMSLRRRQLRR